MYFHFFSTKANDLVNECLLYFNCVASDAICRRKVRFLNKLEWHLLCRLFVKKIADEITACECWSLSIYYVFCFGVLVYQSFTFCVGFVLLYGE